VKKKEYEYDALVSLSGGKDSSTALILAKEKYKLNVLSFTIDKGNFYRGVQETINELTDNLGVDHIFIKVPKSVMVPLFRFGISTLSTGGIQCKICAGLVHIPILSRFLLNHNIPIVLTGLDLWEIQDGYLFNLNQGMKIENPFLYTLPNLRSRWNKYQIPIEDCLNLLQRFSNGQTFLRLKKEFLQITNNLLSRYRLNSSEIEAVNKLKFYDIALTALEISSKKRQLELLKRYRWAPPRDLYTGELVGTDCKIGGVVNAIATFKQKRRMWSSRIRAGLVTKEEALEEIFRKKPNLTSICATLKELGFSQLENRLIAGWNNRIFGDLYDINLINEINKNLN